MGTASATIRERSARDDLDTRLFLLNGFRMEVAGEPLDLPPGAQRVVAFLALRPHALTRGYVAGTLWMDAPEARASANLRSALWRLRSHAVPIVESAGGRLSLHRSVRVDLRAAVELADRWLTGRMTDSDLAAGTATLEADVLPDWYEDWVAAERERFRQLRLHALEAVAERMVQRGRSGDALLAALAAVLADPLRESAHRALISVHLAEGNVGEALRQVRRYERLLADELGVAPSIHLARLIGPLLGRAGEPLPPG
ncbi:MAG TPA: BTAD domain-containing putative transcriptional regulator [Candidatus Limnocylindria bacterium]